MPLGGPNSMPPSHSGTWTLPRPSPLAPMHLLGCAGLCWCPPGATGTEGGPEPLGRRRPSCELDGPDLLQVGERKPYLAVSMARTSR